jgi:hypothetical protein
MAAPRASPPIQPHPTLPKASDQDQFVQLCDDHAKYDFAVYQIRDRFLKIGMKVLDLQDEYNKLDKEDWKTMVTRRRQPELLLLIELKKVKLENKKGKKRGIEDELNKTIRIRDELKKQIQDYCDRFGFVMERWI